MCGDIMGLFDEIKNKCIVQSNQLRLKKIIILTSLFSVMQTDCGKSSSNGCMITAIYQYFPVCELQSSTRYHRDVIDIV